MKKYSVVLVTLVILGFYNFVFASTEVHEEKAPIDAAGQVDAAPFGDVEAGKNKSAACVACHGLNGNSAVSIYPKLAGQNAKYTYKQLQDFKSGARQNPIMADQAAGISDQDMKDIAAYFAEQEASLGMAKKELVELGQKIYRAGNAKTGLPACIACHGPAGKGMPSAGFPLLSGQHADYTSLQLMAFRAAGRGDHGNVQRRQNDGAEGSATMMQDTASKMSDDEIEAVSSYISGLR